MKRLLVSALALFLVLAPGAQAGPALHTSAPSLPLANGTGTAIYDVKEHRITGFYTHMYKKAAADSVTADLADRAGLKVSGVSGAPDQVGYLNGTGILREVRHHGTLQVEHFYFMPLDGNPGRYLVILARVTNRGQTPKSADVTADLHFRLGAGPRPDPNDQSDGVDHKWKGDGKEVMRSTPGALFQSSPASPHRLIFKDLTAAGFKHHLAVKPGRSAWAGVAIGHQEGGDDAHLQRDLERYLAHGSPEKLLAREKAWWKRFHAVEPDLSHLTPDQKAVYRQSTAFLKMGQVREPGTRADGQILASVKDKWARSWIRDASYATVGLVRSGHLDEARRSLEFVLGARRDPRYLPMMNEDLPDGRKIDDYLVSVCRYFGNGTEESDWNDHGPNIEYDGFGLFLWAFSEYAQALPDDQRQAFLDKHVAQVRAKVATPLCRLVDDEIGLIRPDSSIWEHHWTLPLAYDGRRHYAYTSIAAVRGLRSLAALLDKQTAQPYRDAANTIEQGVLRNLLNTDGSIASSLEDLRQDPGTAYDASTLEAVNWGLSTDPRVVERTVERLRSRTPGSPGVMRNDDGNWYDGQEWLLLDLRAVEAYQRLGQRDQAHALLDWVTGWSRANFDGIGELLDEKGDFQGPFPMAGFGPGAYVLATEAVRPARP